MSTIILTVTPIVKITEVVPKFYAKNSTSAMLSAVFIDSPQSHPWASPMCDKIIVKELFFKVVVQIYEQIHICWKKVW